MLISVIIPTYNRAYCIERSIRSVLSQTYSDLELIVVDDCSTDSTESVVNSIVDPRLKYFKMAENGGPCKARNFGIKKSSGDLIAFHDSDDIWHTDKLEKQIELFNNQPECSMVFCKYKVLSNENDVVVPKENSFPEEQKEMFFTLLNENKIGTPTMLVKKEVFEKIGCFDESLFSLEDWEFALRVASKYRIGFCNEVLIDVYASEGGVNQIAGLKRFYTLVRIIELYFDVVEDKGKLKNLLDSVFNEIYPLSLEEKRKCFNILKGCPQIIELMYNDICDLKASIFGEKKIADERQSQLEEMTAKANDNYWDMKNWEKIANERQVQLEEMTHKYQELLASKE